MKSFASLKKPAKPPLDKGFDIIPVIVLFLLILTFVGAQVYFVIEAFLERY